MTEKPETGQNNVTISGDANVRIGALAQGDNATAWYREDRVWEPPGRERDELQALLRDLHEALRREEGGLADPAAVRQEVEKVSAELQRKQPDRGRLTRRLKKIATAAGPAVEIAAAAATLGQAIAGA
jgi:hypothetical protein